MLESLVKQIKIELFKIAKNNPDIRLASSLSCLELLVALYYGKILSFNPKNPFDENRDRFFISKGHGSICFYPILADLGFFDKKELENVGKKGSFLGSIPDPMIPGYESINGSLGHAAGVASGVAMALKNKSKKQNVIALLGDGELNEGSCWEAFMFASYHKLDNLSIIIDCNKVQMLDFTKNILDLQNLKAKFEVFGFEVFEINNAHNVRECESILMEAIFKRNCKAKVIIAHSVKGYGVKSLENKALSHILSADVKEIDQLIEELENENNTQ